MALAFYMDEHIPGPITRGLRQRGVDVLTVQEDGMGGRADPEILARAGILGRVLFTFDDDLLAEARRLQIEGAPFAGLLFAEFQHHRIGQCIADLELMAGVCDPAELRSKVEFLPL